MGLPLALHVPTSTQSKEHDTFQIVLPKHNTLVDGAQRLAVNCFTAVKTISAKSLPPCWQHNEIAAEVRLISSFFSS